MEQSDTAMLVFDLRTASFGWSENDRGSVRAFLASREDDSATSGMIMSRPPKD